MPIKDYAALMKVLRSSIVTPYIPMQVTPTLTNRITRRYGTGKFGTCDPLFESVTNVNSEKHVSAMIVWAAIGSMVKSGTGIGIIHDTSFTTFATMTGEVLPRVDVSVWWNDTEESEALQIVKVSGDFAFCNFSIILEMVQR